MRGVIILCGNDGTGKTTITKLAKDNDYLVIERNSVKNLHSDSVGHIRPEIIDDLTLLYPYDDHYKSTVLPDFTKNRVPIYWVILDCNVDTIVERIKDRDNRDKWETPKSLFYFQQKFRELSAYHGLPLLDTTSMTRQEVLDAVLEIPKYYYEVRSIALRTMTHKKIRDGDVENRPIVHDLDKLDKHYRGALDDLYKCDLFQRDDKVLQEALDPEKILARYQRYMRLGNFRLEDEGESKRIYRIMTDNPYLKNLRIIVLKSTIYSHSKQSTGVIDNLGSIRAVGTQIFLEMMHRNGLRHTYRAINDHGIILSDFLPEVPPTEIVVKKYCEGTDKHSFYGMRTDASASSCALPNGEYANGPYVRFDWRNPNHVCKSSDVTPSTSPYYYVVEELMGKEEFFEHFLKPTAGRATPMGDKSVSEELAASYINTAQTKASVLKMFHTIQYYFREVGMEIKDVCFKLDKSGELIRIG